jgi:hypothetical protein
MKTHYYYKGIAIESPLNVSPDHDEWFDISIGPDGPKTKAKFNYATGVLTVIPLKKVSEKPLVQAALYAWSKLCYKRYNMSLYQAELQQLRHKQSIRQLDL